MADLLKPLAPSSFALDTAKLKVVATYDGTSTEATVPTQKLTAPGGNIELNSINGTDELTIASSVFESDPYII